MTPLQLKQMKASGGINKLAAEHIEYLQKTINVSARIMKEKQATIEHLKERVALMEGMINEGVGWEDMARDVL